MEKKLIFTVEGEKREFTAKRLINAGYTGRNKKEVEEHMEELRKMGISAPEKVPCFFPKSSELIQNNGSLFPLDEDCSSEAEYVILVDHDELLISCGSDVFDFKVEGLQADKSKCLYPNYISDTAWRYHDVKDHWDKLILRSWIGENRETLYQEGALEGIMTVEQLLEEIRPYLEDGVTEGTVIYSGTLACLVDGMPYTDCFETELYDPVFNRSINKVFRLEKINWFKNK